MLELARSLRKGATVTDIKKAFGEPQHVEHRGRKESTKTVWRLLRYELHWPGSASGCYVEFRVSADDVLRSTRYQLHDPGPQTRIYESMLNGGVRSVKVLRGSAIRAPSDGGVGVEDEPPKNVECARVFSNNVPHEDELLTALGLLTSVEKIEKPRGAYWDLVFYSIDGRHLGSIRLPDGCQCATIEGTTLDRVEELRQWLQETGVCQ